MGLPGFDLEDLFLKALFGRKWLIREGLQQRFQRVPGRLGSKVSVSQPLNVHAFEEVFAHEVLHVLECDLLDLPVIIPKRKLAVFQQQTAVVERLLIGLLEVKILVAAAFLFLEFRKNGLAHRGIAQTPSDGLDECWEFVRIAAEL